MKKILVAVEKPFSKEATRRMRRLAEEARYTCVLLEKYTKEQLMEALQDASALIVRSDKVTKEWIEAAPKLQIIVRAGAGYDNIDLATATERGIVVMNTPGQNANAVAELAIGMMIYMARHHFKPGTGTEIREKRLGIHAYGNVGRLVGQHGKAMGMRVIAYDPYISDKSIFHDDHVWVSESIQELYEQSDYLSLHIPATPETIGSIGYDLLMTMPEGATLVNTARKEVIDEAGLVRAMTEREDLKYVTDIAPSNAAEMTEKFGDRFFATSAKMGAETAEANMNAGVAAVKEIVDYFTTGNEKYRVNK